MVFRTYEINLERARGVVGECARQDWRDTFRVDASARRGDDSTRTRAFISPVHFARESVFKRTTGNTPKIHPRELRVFRPERASIYLDTISEITTEQSRPRDTLSPADGSITS